MIAADEWTVRVPRRRWLGVDSGLDGLSRKGTLAVKRSLFATFGDWGWGAVPPGSKQKDTENKRYG